MKKIIYCLILIIFSMGALCGCGAEVTTPPVLETTPTAEPTARPTSVPTPGPAFTFSPLYTPEPTATPDYTVEPTEEPIPTEAPIPSNTPDSEITPAPSRTEDPTKTPAPVPTPTPGGDIPNNDYYIYTLERGDGKYPYAWTEACPVKSDEITYGTRSNEVAAIQARLTQLGFYGGRTASVYNSSMKDSINDFQRVVGLKVTENITRETIDTLFSPDGIPGMEITEYEIPVGLLNGITVFVDAGHGGNDTGTARGSLVEKTMVLETAYRLKAMLEKAGARVIMTRTDDGKPSLQYRSALANDVMMQDLIAEANEKIALVASKIASINSLKEVDPKTLAERADELTVSIKSMMYELDKARDNTQSILAEYGKISPEYVAAKASETDIEKAADALRFEYDLVMLSYYSAQMNMELSAYIEAYEAELGELNDYVAELNHYRELLAITLEDPTSAEYKGLWAYDNFDGPNKIIDPELKKIFDITGEKCSDKYVFMSIHVNGIDNASHINGTEIYVRNSNHEDANYDDNRLYYTNYNLTQRDELAKSLKDVMERINPLQTEKAAVIKDEDFFVLREVNIPTILLETGYVTNEIDRVAMQTPQVRNSFAYAMYRGICEFYFG